MQRDVPGITRAAIPILNRQGVIALSQGVNGASAPPGIPKNTPLIWKDPASGAQLIHWVHPGLSHQLTSFAFLRRRNDDGHLRRCQSLQDSCTSQLPVLIHSLMTVQEYSSYEHRLQSSQFCSLTLSTLLSQSMVVFLVGGYSGSPQDQPEECLKVQNFGHVLCHAWKQDNQGPHTVAEVHTVSSAAPSTNPKNHTCMLVQDGNLICVTSSSRCRRRRHIKYIRTRFQGQRYLHPLLTATSTSSRRHCQV